MHPLVNRIIAARDRIVRVYVIIGDRCVIVESDQRETRGFEWKSSLVNERAK